MKKDIVSTGTPLPMATMPLPSTAAVAREVATTQYLDLKRKYVSLRDGVASPEEQINF